MRRGPGTNEEQIESLRSKMAVRDTQQAEQIAVDCSPSVLSLAYKLMRASASKDKLPKSVTKLLGNLSEEDGEIVRGLLVQANQV